MYILYSVSTKLQKTYISVAGNVVNLYLGNFFSRMNHLSFSWWVVFLHWHDHTGPNDPLVSFYAWVVLMGILVIVTVNEPTQLFIYLKVFFYIWKVSCIHKKKEMKEWGRKKESIGKTKRKIGNCWKVDRQGETSDVPQYCSS